MISGKEKRWMRQARHKISEKRGATKKVFEGAVLQEEEIMGVCVPDMSA